MPITEIVRVLAVAEGPGGTSWELLYDVDGTMRPDEETLGWPQFWLREVREGELHATHGPFPTEDEAVEEAERRGGEW